MVHNGDDPPPAAAFAAPTSVATGDGAVAAAAQSPTGPAVQVRYTIEKCDAGPLLYRGSTEQISPNHLAARLAAVYPLFLIVDFRKLAIPRPKDCQAMDYLFDWLTPQAAAIASPVFFSAGDVAAWPEIVENAWGMDAVVYLFSKQDRPALGEHLRQSLRGKRRRERGVTAMVGCCWPSVLAMLLAHGRPSHVAELLAGIEAVLVEMPDLPETWQIYAQEPIAAALAQLGFVEAGAEASVPVQTSAEA